MKHVMTILIAGLLSLGSFSQAKIEFETKTIDYGTIEKGSDGVRVFKFKNTGDEPLIISKVSSSCGCTIPKKPKDPILPGESGEIEVKYDTKRVNPIRKTVTVISNAKDNPTVALKIKGIVLNHDRYKKMKEKEEKKK